MKKIVVLLSISLIAINARTQTIERTQLSIEKQIDYSISKSAGRSFTGQDTAGYAYDTANFDPAFNFHAGHPTLYSFGQLPNLTGYLYGNNGSTNNFTEVAQGYINKHHYDLSFVGVLCWFGAKQSDLGSDTTSHVTIKAYQMDTNMAYNIKNGHFNVDTLNFPGPSVVKAQADLLFSNIMTGDSVFTYVPFSSPAWIFGVSDFAIGCNFSGLAPGDTVGLMSDKKGDAYDFDYAFHYAGDSMKWIVSDQLFSDTMYTDGLNNNIALWAVISSGTGVKEFYNGVKLTAYPNPTMENTTIEYTLEKNSKNVSLLIIDPSGKKIMETNYGNQSSGNYSVNLPTEKLASGSYFYQLRANGQIITKQLIVSK